MKRYRTRKIFKNGKRPRIVDTGLTLKEAQAKVDEDLKINPKAVRYMLVYDEQ